MDTWVHYKTDTFKWNWGLLVLRYLLEMGFINLFFGIYWKKREGICGMCLWGLIKSPHVPVQHPGHISNACSAQLCCWNMKYAWTIKSIWTIHLNIRYSEPSKRSLNQTHTRLFVHTQVHTKWHINMHSHVVHNGLSVLSTNFCWQCACNKKKRHAHMHLGEKEGMWH